MEPFVTNLRYQTKLLGLSYAEAARRIGLSERRFGNYVKGDREPDLATLVRICQALNCSPSDLLGMESQAKSSRKTDRTAKLVTLCEQMTEEDLELFIVQAEAVVIHRSSKENR